MNRIIYENQDGSISILIPSQEALDKFGINAIAKKDVPQGLSYWLVSDTDIPSDRTFRDAWIKDESLGSPDGVGSAYHTFEGVINEN